MSKQFDGAAAALEPTAGERLAFLAGLLIGANSRELTSLIKESQLELMIGRLSDEWALREKILRRLETWGGIFRTSKALVVLMGEPEAS
jgi:hypothetical protein